MHMGRVNTGISIDEEVLKAIDADAKRTAKANGIKWSRSKQIEWMAAEKYGLLQALVRPYLPQSITPKATRG